jgi:hypothetical protein
MKLKQPKLKMKKKDTTTITVRLTRQEKQKLEDRARDFTKETGDYHSKSSLVKKMIQHL